MSEHTPGPWYLKDIRDDPKKAESWAIYSDVEAEDPEIAWDVRKEANARLIAAAPELLKALKQAREEIRELTDDAPEFAPDYIDQAITKAERRGSRP